MAKKTTTATQKKTSVKVDKKTTALAVATPAKSKSKAKAEAHGLTVLPVAEAVKKADITMVLIPDEKQADVYKTEIGPNLKKLYDELTGIQYGERPDKHDWLVEC